MTQGAVWIEDPFYNVKIPTGTDKMCIIEHVSDS